MKKFLPLIPLLFCLVACGNSNDPLIALNNNAIDGVIEIINSPVDITSPHPNSEDEENHQGTSDGSGFIIKPNVIVTNYHVIDGDNRHLVVLGHNDLKPYKATIIAGDKNVDIAIIKLDDWDDFVKNVNPPMLKWGKSSELKQGQAVWALGHPYGLTWTLTDGIISNVLRNNPQDPNSFYIQTNTSINPGNSGGPLFNRSGEVIGINSAIYGEKGYVGLTIPSDLANKIVNDFLNGGKVRSAMLGIIMKPSSDQHHIAIKALRIGSNGIAAGLLPDDILLEIKSSESNGWVPIHSAEDLLYETKLLHIGDIVQLYTQRDQMHMTVSFAMVDPTKLKIRSK